LLDIQKADGLFISVNEHNGALSAYFKNLLDWLSRLDRRFLADKRLLLMATSGGKRGALGALGQAEQLLARFGAEVTATFSLPLFHEHFTEGSGIGDTQLAEAHKEALQRFLNVMGSEA
jgi:NAD(P)H-dependent FMN reductase